MLYVEKHFGQFSVKNIEFGMEYELENVKAKISGYHVLEDVMIWVQDMDGAVAIVRLDKQLL